MQSGVSSPPEMPSELVERRKKDRLFLEQLLDTSKLENYSVPIFINADLRKYQQVSGTALMTSRKRDKMTDSYSCEICITILPIVGINFG